MHLMLWPIEPFKIFLKHGPNELLHIVNVYDCLLDFVSTTSFIVYSSNINSFLHCFLRFAGFHLIDIIHLFWRHLGEFSSASALCTKQTRTGRVHSLFVHNIFVPTDHHCIK